MKIIPYILAVFLIISGFSGCTDESRDFTMHEPGVYKGTKDPLLSKAQQQELIDRFKMVQTDR
jgi:hypothetical protein